MPPAHIRGPRGDFVLVPAVDILQPHDEAELVAYFERSVQDDAAARTLLAAAQQFDPSVEDAVAAVRLLAHAVARGKLVMVRMEQPARVLDAPTSRPLLSEYPTTPDEPATPRSIRPTWIEVRCLGAGGQSYAGAQLRALLPDGTRRSVRLDHRSIWRSDDLPSGGDCSVRLLEGQGPNTGMRGVENFVPTPAMARIRVGGNDVSLATEQSHTIVVEARRATCLKLIGLNFALNKTFVLPSALEGIRLLEHMYDKMPSAEVLVVGHTDRTGSPETNRSLSLERAQAIAAFLRDDVDAWLAQYGPSTKKSRRWGRAEDLAMLAALPRDHEPYYGSHHADHSFEAALRRFQDAHLLSATGEPDVATRRALVQQYMAEDQTTLPNDARIVSHGCGEHFPSVPTDDGVEELENRRVEVFFFANGVEPAPSQMTSSESDGDYPRWLEQVEEERSFRPSAEGRGKLTVVTDIFTEGAEHAGVTFFLRSTDGSYEQQRSPEVDGIDADGFVDLEFTDIPRRAFVSLSVRYASGSESTVVEDVPFLELSRLGERVEPDVVHPFEPSLEDQA